ncbi:hypothetical protein AK830_g3033 [Neonectria ditissima]|uniref:Transcription factor Iwr1 domain-containing protein n=1 Tax=Neonectria ditissima TaxID=78410 RepID=A0A0P7B0J9_9HYPO|nr:hypothetical protein AK830_g3033 [Neonectria ditissima]
MSIPPQLIRVKRKRVEESPVTFLQFDESAKRHRTGSNWVYQRRLAKPHSPAHADTQASRDLKPTIHVSSPDNGHSKAPKHDAGQGAQAAGDSPDAQASNQPEASKLAEPRRFHISKKMMMPTARTMSGLGVSKKVRYGPAVFVERSRAKASKRASRATTSSRQSPSATPGQHDQTTETRQDSPLGVQRLKKPSVRSRSRSPLDPGHRAPLPTSSMSPHTQDLSKVAADMNDWVMKEIGANLHSMEQEKQKSERTKFKPKAPAQRYQERHPGAAQDAPEGAEIDTTMSDVSDMDDEDEWVIEEYIRIPAHAMTVDVAPTDVGLLVLDGKEDSTLFFGLDEDDDDDNLDDEDENAEGHYTADYPEDEVDSDDEYGRQPYGYRNGNASDDEEFDHVQYESEDEMVIEGADEDATMARIKAYMKRNRAFQ